MDSVQEFEIPHLIMRFVLCLIAAMVKEGPPQTMLSQEDDLDELCCMYSRGNNAALFWNLV